MSGWPFGALTMFGYRLIVADPPWRFKLRSEATGWLMATGEATAVARAWGFKPQLSP